jgi:hypothetical protein
MKTDVRLWLYLAEFFLECEVFQANVVEILRAHNSLHNNIFSPENRALYERMCKKCGRTGQAADNNVRVIRRMRITCWIPKAINTQSKYVILIALPRQQYFRERASMVHYSIGSVLLWSCHWHLCEYFSLSMRVLYFHKCQQNVK